MMDEPVETKVARIEEVVLDFRTFLLAFDAFRARAIPRSALPYTPDYIAKSLRTLVAIRRVNGPWSENDARGLMAAHSLLSTVLPDDEAQLVNTFVSLERLLGGPGVATQALLEWSVFQTIPTILGRLDVARNEADQAFEAILAKWGVGK